LDSVEAVLNNTGRDGLGRLAKQMKTSRQIRRFLVAAILLVPGLALSIIAFDLPVLSLLGRGFDAPNWSLRNFARLLSTPAYVQVLWNTFEISALVTLSTLVVSYPLAHMIAHARPPVKRWLILMVLVPFWTSLLVRTFAWTIVLQRNGLINQALLALGIIDQPLNLIRNLPGALLGMVQIEIPFVVFPLAANMSRIDPRIMGAALTLGASPARAFLRIYLPLTVPGLMTGATLVFIMALGFFVMPALLGAPADQMAAQIIEDQIGLFGDWGGAGAMSVILVVVCVGLMALLNRFVRLKSIWAQS
jgi:putative spermidine/putrescine transport system permease protein